MDDYKKPVRCSWCGENELYIDYHDREWGVPLHDEQRLFELLTLEGAQAGLSWLTVLKKRADYKIAFNDFNLDQVARFSEAKVSHLLTNNLIIRNKLKILSAIKNAQVILKLQQEFGSFDSYLWNFVDGSPIQHDYEKETDLPATDDVANKLSKDLKIRGMNFVGPTICYSFMQANGMVNDHVKNCFRYTELAKG